MIPSLLFIVFFSLTSPYETRELPDDLSGDARAIYLYGRMRGALDGAQSLYIESEQEFYSIKEGEKDYSSTSYYKAWLRKPNHARIEARRKKEELHGVLVGDGGHFYSYWPNGTLFFYAYGGQGGIRKPEYNVFMKKPAPQGKHSLGHEINYIGAHCVQDLSEFHGYEESLTPHLEEILIEDEEAVAGELCDVIRLKFMKGQRERLLWLSRKDHLPRKLKSIVHVSYDIFTDETWNVVRVNEEMDPSLFQWTPPEGWEERGMPDPNDGLLRKGAPAPAFALLDAKGNEVKFSDFAGKPLWIMFWRVG